MNRLSFLTARYRMVSRGRKSKRSTKRSTKRSRSHRQRGGFVEMKNVPTNSNLQGQNYLAKHEGQYGGVAELSHDGSLPSDLHGAARIAPLDHAFAEIQGMKDQAGGRRRRKTHGGKRRGTKKTRKSKKTRRNLKKKQRGGNASVDEPTMLLSGSQAGSAVAGMNPEWKMAENPSSFEPSK